METPIGTAQLMRAAELARRLVVGKYGCSWEAQPNAWRADRIAEAEEILAIVAQLDVPCCMRAAKMEARVQELREVLNDLLQMEDMYRVDQEPLFARAAALVRGG